MDLIMGDDGVFREYKPYISIDLETKEDFEKLQQLLNLAKRMQWHPYPAEKPEDDRMLLVTCRTKSGNKNVNRAYFDGISWHGNGSMAGVIAWMDMPEPYEEE